MKYGLVRSLILVCAMTMCAVGSLSAQDYPTKVIKMVLPFAAGSPTDALLRIISEPLSKRLEKPIIIENRPGADGMTGTAYVAQTRPDGYTLLFGTNTTQVANKFFFKNINYDGLKDFEPVVAVGGIPHVLVVTSSLQVNSVQDLIDYAKQRSGGLLFPYANSTTRITGNTFRVMTGANVAEVPYRVYGDAVRDLISGRVQFMFIDLATGLPQIEAGHLRALAVTPNRSGRLPGVPAMKEVLPGFEIGNWNGLFAPAGTPTSIIERLHREMNAVLDMPEVQKQIEKIGYELLPRMSSNEFGQYMAKESVEYGRLTKNAGIKPQ